MRKTPRGLRVHIALFGRRNVGKSSLLNALTGQRVSIVSPEAGTTTDPVTKPMELQPIGPVLFIDTAGLDDVGALGALRTARSRKVIERADVAILVARADTWGAVEDAVVAQLRDRGTPMVVALNQVDRVAPAEEVLERLVATGLPAARTAAPTGEGLDTLRGLVADAVPPEHMATPTLMGDLVPAGGLAVLVTPIDKEAPKGRLILPQVQAIRDLLDHKATCVVCQDGELRAVLDRLRTPPDLVVTDSQAFDRVAAVTPASVPMTSFSILYARLKGDLPAMARAAAVVDDLGPGDRVLVAEACTHHPVEDDIGRVKIPAWLAQKAGGPMEIDTVSGRDWPADLDGYRMVIHCGACVWNRRQVRSRLAEGEDRGIPISNYGLVIAATLGILPRALEPFPDALAAWRGAAAPPDIE